MRALFLALNERMSREVDSIQRVVMFIREYAAYLISRVEVGKDGKTSYERDKGKKPSVVGPEFGEKWLYQVKLNDKMENINARWESGIFVRIGRKSNELWIANKDKGIVSVRSVRKIPSERRWDEDSVACVKGAPWNR